MVIDRTRRIKSLKEELRLRRLDSFLITNAVNVSYLSGFTGHDALILVTRSEDFFITDSRYIEEAQNSIKGFSIRLVQLSTYGTLKEIVSKRRLKRIGFESMDLPYEVAVKLRRQLGGASLVPVRDLIEGLRSIKDASELILIKDAIKLAKATFGKISKLVRPGIAENFIARNAELEFIKNGAQVSFEPIVAAGANSSKPHALPTGSKIAKNSFVMMDMGCRLNGYCSDITRMFVVGAMNKKFKEIYSVVIDAHDMAIDMVRPGARISDIDRCARDYIQKKGFGKYFGHALGHGVGMEVHELPAISRTNEEMLKPGMVFTIEPAIYIPKFGGVRIEDMVLVKRNGCEILTS